MFTPATDRLFWTLNGPLESAIQVTPNRYYEPGDVMEPYFRPVSAEESASGLEPSWHPVSQESLMAPPVTTITVRVEALDEWEQLWAELNRYCVADTLTDPNRPRAKDVQLEVTTAGTFLTIHEYVSAVHPWLMGMRERILDALGKLKLGAPWPPETKLAVHLLGGPIYIGAEDGWARRHKKPSPPLMVEMTLAENEEFSRKVRERMMARSAARIRELERIRQEGGN
ncbi:hypothetical protein CSIM01_10171 [Colletotrichum simmondsii]|uniref:Uncharacterized protein n=1 Tax=Colletotrichum simmondsii TaxID=703756 RepID=A0A135SWY1_9PEZI|nr:hypothetical protein CSIM01_10171 [Colletotrichum simmondsii]